jgi:hypothetical protein
MNNGIIKSNRALGSNSGGACITGGQFQFVMKGGTIGGKNPEDANIAISGANGVYSSSSAFIISGGVITGNTAAGSNNYGVYAGGGRWAEFMMTGSAQVTKDNMVFLTPDTTIAIGDNLNALLVANIICDNPSAGTTRLLRASSPTLIEENYDKFLYNGEENHIKGNPANKDQYDNIWYGVYQ